MNSYNSTSFDVIIVGGSYSGLAAGMAMGRALMKVLIIDDGKPCNRQTPHSHNFITQDGVPPAEISSIARRQVEKYDTVKFFAGSATLGSKTGNGFEIEVATGEKFEARKLIFASGIKDMMPAIPGYSECWGISVLHCPYCHGYEVKNQKTGILANGEDAMELAAMIRNWTSDLVLYTNGKSALSGEQAERLEKHEIKIVEKEFDRLEHQDGQLHHVVFSDGSKSALLALYSRNRFEQQCQIPISLGCEMTEDGYIKIDPFQETTVNGVFACGDNVTRMRTVANSVAMGTMAGMTASKKLIMENF
jgi:thioredoxin reductase